jgi:hypothetical protein
MKILWMLTTLAALAVAVFVLRSTSVSETPREAEVGGTTGYHLKSRGGYKTRHKNPSLQAVLSRAG